tara:strand:+ start:2059 stop:2448 length:390 start_codon:yes stop_codon:yes gene_type:complete
MPRVTKRKDSVKYEGGGKTPKTYSTLAGDAKASAETKASKGAGRPVVYDKDESIKKARHVFKAAGGKGMKFNPKYTRGSADVAERKRLMQQIADIYKKHRGTKAQRKKKGFPPAVEARLKRLMKQRDKI